MIAEATAYGFTFRYPARDLAVGRCLRDHGEFARVESALAAQLCRDGAFVDVGANIGAIALPVAKQARQVIAVEAHRGLAELLRENVAANSLTNVEVVHAALSDRRGDVEFPTPSLADARNFGDTGLGQPTATVEVVPCRTLDDLAPADTKVVKIDVQGHELAVLAGAADTLTRLRPTALVEVGGDSPRARDVIRALVDHDYAAYWLFSPFVTPLAQGAWRDEEEILGDINVAAFPRERPQPQAMKRIDLDAGWPSDVTDFPYLRQFGFRVA